MPDMSEAKMQNSVGSFHLRASFRIVPIEALDELTSDNSEIPAKLSIERADELARLIYLSYKQCSGL